MREITSETRNIGAFTLAEIRYAPGLTLPRHEHGQAGFCLAFEGNYVESYGRERLDVSPRTLTFSPAGAPHANTFSQSGAHCFTVDVAPAWLAEHDGEVAAPDAPAKFSDVAVVSAARRLFREFHRDDDVSAIAIEGLTLELIATTFRARPRLRGAAPRWLRVAEELLRERFATRVRVADVAAESGVHPVHLAATFRAHHGCTIGTFVRELRIDSAARMLASTDTPLADVALQCGFANQSHFSREFRRATSFTPAGYRRAHRS
jgi:AraC family transcriptional regulator